METASACPLCPELSRSLKKLEGRFSEECKWNLAQGQYCRQLQEEMQRDKDLWQREEHKLRENLKDLSNKIESLQKSNKEQHKERAHLEFMNEALEDQNQELQNKVTTLQDKVKDLCAEMSKIQYRARILEEKLTAATKSFVESQMLQVRISKTESQKARLEVKLNRLQKEKQQWQAELNHMKDKNCQMEMQLIELQQKLSCLDTRTQQMQANLVWQNKSDSSLVSHCFREDNCNYKESKHFLKHQTVCASVNELQNPTEEINYKDKNSATFPNNCTLQWQQQTAFQNSGVAEIHKVTEIHALTPIDVADNATESCNVIIQFTEDSVENNEIKKSSSSNKISHKTVFLDGKKTAYGNSELNNYETCTSCGRETQMNVCKEDFESIQKSLLMTKISDNVVNLNENSTTSRIGYVSGYEGRNDIHVCVSANAVQKVITNFADKEENFNTNIFKEVCVCRNKSWIYSGKDQFVTPLDEKSESFSTLDKDIKNNAVYAIPHAENVNEMKKRTASTCNNTNIGPVYTNSMSQIGRNIETKKQANMMLKIEASNASTSDSIKSLEEESLRADASSNKRSLSVLSKKTENRKDNCFMNKKTKPQYNKYSENERETTLDKTNILKCEINNEHSKSYKKSSKTVATRSNEGNLSLERSSERSSPRGSDLHINREKLIINSKFSENDLLHKHHMPPYKETTHYEDVSQLLNYNYKNSNNNNNNNMLHRNNTHQCSKNTQTQDEMLNENITSKCGTSSEGYLNSKEASRAACKRAHESNKHRVKFNISNKKDKAVENEVEQRIATQCNKIIQTEKEVQSYFLNKNTTSVDNSLIHKKNTTQKNKNGVQTTVLNTSNSIVDDNVTPKGDTLQSENGIQTILLYKNNSNYNFLQNKNISQCEKNIQAQSGVHIIALNKTCKILDENLSCMTSISQDKNEIHSGTLYKNNKNVDDNIILQCDKNNQTQNGIQSVALNKNNKIVHDILMHEGNTSQYNKDSHTASRIHTIVLNESINTIDDYKKNSLQCNKNIQNENRIEPSVLYTNNNLNDNSTHIKSTSHNEKENQCIALYKNNNANNEIIQKRHILQCKKSVDTQIGVQSMDFNKYNSTMYDQPVYKANTQSENGVYSVAIGTNSSITTDRYNDLQCNKHIHNENEIHCNALSKHCNIVDDYLVPQKNTSQSNKDFQSDNGIHCIALSNNSDITDAKLTFKNNTLQHIQPVYSSKTRNTVDDELAHTQYNKDIQNESGIQSIVLNKSNNSVDNDLLYKNSAVQCNKECSIENRTFVLEPEVLREARGTYLTNCSTSSVEVCHKYTETNLSNDMFESIKATKTFKKVNPLFSLGEMGLVSAAKEGKFSDVEKQLSLGTCPNCVYNGSTALHAAAQTGDLSICKLLLEAGARVDSRDSFSGTPLHAAAKCGNLEVGKLLVRWGASIEHRDRAGNLASDIAMNNGHIHMYIWLKEKACLQE